MNGAKQVGTRLVCIKTYYIVYAKKNRWGPFKILYT